MYTLMKNTEKYFYVPYLCVLKCAGDKYELYFDKDRFYVLLQYLREQFEVQTTRRCGHATMPQLLNYILHHSIVIYVWAI